MKKALKIGGIILGILIVLLALSPFLFRNSLEKFVIRTINKNLNATVAWKDMDLSLFRSFPDAALTIHDFTVINKAPFEGDTLASGKTLKLDMGIMQLFKSSNESIKVDALALEETFVNIKIDSLGNANYDIAIKDDAPVINENASKAGSFTFDLQKYEIRDSRINYLDEATKTFLILKNINHEGTGDFSLDVSKLETHTDALASLRIDDIEYLSDNQVALDADFNMDLKNQKYTFLENEAKINELPLTFDGFVKVNENNNEIDLTFKTPSSDFKNFLAVIPKTYVKEIKDVNTTGNFTVNGMIKGIVDEEHIPKMDIKIASDNASFKYPDLPKAVENISIDAHIKNETGLAKDTYINIGGLTFKIDNEVFSAYGSLRNLTENILVNMAIKGSLNLAHIEQVLPVKLEQKLNGIIRADITTNFDMESVDKEQYQNINTNGTATVTDFNYSDKAFKNDLKISKATITMTPGNNIKLNELLATSGQTDVKASGNIHNLIPFLISKQNLKGRFSVQSNTFNINDFMASESETSETTSKNKSSNKTVTTSEKAVKIPGFLDATLDFSAKKVVYDNLELDNAKGTVVIKNETATLSNVTSSFLGGNIALAGNVSTLNATPTFVMDLDLSKINIAESFQKLELLQFLAPIAQGLQGNLNTKLQLHGNLNNDLTPILTTLAGDALAQIITAEIDPEKTPLLSKLNASLSFLHLDELSLRDLSTVLKFNNGFIEVQPFDFNVKGIKVTAAGKHGLDKSLDYNVTLDVPAKYLGSEVGNLLAKLSPEDANNMTVALPIGLKGTFNNPQISVNTEAAVQKLTQKLIEKQKQNLIKNGTDILGDIITGANTPKDSTQTTDPTTTQQNTTKIVKDILGGLLGGQKKQQDTTKTGN